MTYRWRDDGPFLCQHIVDDAHSTPRFNQADDAVLEICAGSQLPHSLLQNLLKAAEADGSLTPEELRRCRRCRTPRPGIPIGFEATL